MDCWKSMCVVASPNLLVAGLIMSLYLKSSTLLVGHYRWWWPEFAATISYRFAGFGGPVLGRDECMCSSEATRFAWPNFVRSRDVLEAL